jgi:hypothetical protein
MLIRPSSLPPVQSEPTIHWRSNSRHTIGWTGTPFISGHRVGDSTIEHLLARLAQCPAAALLPSLHGVYGIFIYDHAAQNWLVATDNTGLYRIFYTPEAVANRFLELATAMPASQRQLDDQAIIEFIAHGGNFGRQTPVTTIKRLRRNEIIELRASASPAIRVLEKVLDEHEEDAEDYVLDYFADVATAFAEQRVSVDLTGGFDSRVAACLLAHAGLPFECALIGTPGSGEVRSAQTAAAALGRAFHLHEHDITALDRELHEIFLVGDGLTDMSGLHRDLQLCRSRLARGIDSIVHSGCGEFFSDRFYIQDFPRYGSRHSNVAKFYRLRITPIVIMDKLLTRYGLELRQNVASDTIKKFHKSQKETNNLSYDWIFFKYKAPEYFGPIYSNYINSGLSVEAAFLNFRVAKSGMQISPWQRIFQLWHRRMITAHCPKLADIQIFPAGYSASSRPGRMVAELGTYARFQAGRVARKLTERYLGKTLFHNATELATDIPGYRDGLRRSMMFATAVARLQEKGLLCDRLDKDDIANVHVARIMTMGTLLDHLDRS